MRNIILLLLFFTKINFNTTDTDSLESFLRVFAKETLHLSENNASYSAKIASLIIKLETLYIIINAIIKDQIEKHTKNNNDLIRMKESEWKTKFNELKKIVQNLKTEIEKNKGIIGYGKYLDQINKKNIAAIPVFELIFNRINELQNKVTDLEKTCVAQNKKHQQPITENRENLMEIVHSWEERLTGEIFLSESKNGPQSNTLSPDFNRKSYESYQEENLLDSNNKFDLHTPKNSSTTQREFTFFESENKSFENFQSSIEPQSPIEKTSVKRLEGSAYSYQSPQSNNEFTSQFKEVQPIHNSTETEHYSPLEKTFDKEAFLQGGNTIKKWEIASSIRTIEHKEKKEEEDENLLKDYISNTNNTGDNILKENLLLQTRPEVKLPQVENPLKEKA